MKPKEKGARRGGRPSRECSPFWTLLSAAAEKMEDDSGGDPIVVLVKSGAEGGAIVIGVD